MGVFARKGLIMADVYDYLTWRGDVPFSFSPFNEIDGMILARLSYLPFDAVTEQRSFTAVPLEKARETLLSKHASGERKLTKNQQNILSALKNCDRYSQVALCYYVNVFEERNQTQFAAVTFSIGENRYFAAYRGTDNTLVGWKENFNMSFSSTVPAQELALEYLNTVGNELLSRPAAKNAENPLSLIVGGHSKGGNLAVYAAAFADKELQPLIEKVYNYDGPGFNDAIILSPGYQRICSRVTTLVPQSAIVGMLLEHEEKYTIVRSTNSSIWQHDTASWQLTRDGFTRLESVTSSSRFIDYTLKAWMNSMSRERRERFVDACYTVLIDTDASTLREIGANKYSSLRKIVASFRSLDEPTRKDVTFAFKLLLRSAKLGMIRMLGDK